MILESRQDVRVASVHEVATRLVDIGDSPRAGQVELGVVPALSANGRASARDETRRIVEDQEPRLAWDAPRPERRLTDEVHGSERLKACE
jgi:hypothetical protein